MKFIRVIKANNEIKYLNSLPDYMTNDIRYSSSSHLPLILQCLEEIKDIRKAINKLNSKYFNLERDINNVVMVFNILQDIEHIYKTNYIEEDEITLGALDSYLEMCFNKFKDIKQNYNSSNKTISETNKIIYDNLNNCYKILHEINKNL